MTTLPRGFEPLLAYLNEASLEHDVDARDLHSTLGCKVPFSLWFHREFVQGLVADEGEDWTATRGPFGKSALLSRESALWAAQRVNSPMGNAILHVMGMRFQSAMRLLRSQPGNEDLNTIEGMFARVKAHAEERERFRTITGSPLD